MRYQPTRLLRLLMKVPKASSSLVSEKPPIAIGLTEWPFQTPEASQCQNSDCQIVGNKFYQLISEESHHSKWEEFRRGALSDSMNEDCANLLRRMELEESDSEVDTFKSEMAMDEELISLGELVKDKEANCVDKSQQVEDIQNVQVQEEVMQPDGEQEVVQANKRRKRQWGPSLRVDRPRRAPEDERTVMQKAQDLKKDRDKMQGCTVEWDEEGVCYGGKNAKKLVADVHTGGQGESGAGDTNGGGRSRLSTAAQVECGYIRVGSINCSAFGGSGNAPILQCNRA